MLVLAPDRGENVHKRDKGVQTLRDAHTIFVNANVKKPRKSTSSFASLFMEGR